MPSVSQGNFYLRSNQRGPLLIEIQFIPRDWQLLAEMINWLSDRTMPPTFSSILCKILKVPGENSCLHFPVTNHFRHTILMGKRSTNKNNKNKHSPKPHIIKSYFFSFWNISLKDNAFILTHTHTHTKMHVYLYLSNSQGTHSASVNLNESTHLRNIYFRLLQKPKHLPIIEYCRCALTRHSPGLLSRPSKKLMVKLVRQKDCNASV